MNSIADIYNGKLTKEEEKMGLELKKEMEKRFDGYDDDMGKEVPEELINIDGIVYIDSRTVALKLGKDGKYGHKNIMKKINDLLLDIGEIHGSKNIPPSLMSIESTYKTSRGNIYKCYLLSRDMFNLVVMGSNGKDALKFKIAYIEKFNLMERTISSIKSIADNAESANKSMELVFNEINKYEKENRELLKRMSNISEFHKKELQMESNARFEAESKLKMYSHIINDVDTLSNGGNTIFNLPPHQEEKIINAGRRLEEIRARRNKKRYY